MLDKALEKTLDDAHNIAYEKGHEFITIEHLLLALLNNQSAREILETCADDIYDLEIDLEDFIADQLPKLSTMNPREPQPTKGFQRVIQRALLHVQSAEKKMVRGADVVVAIFSERNSHAVYFLEQQNISRLDVVNFISYGRPLIKEGGEEGPINEHNEHQQIDDEEILDALTINLNKKAREGHIDPLIGREAEIQRTVQILCRRRKNNPLYVGEAGVGKTAIVEGIAKLIVQKKFPELLSKSTIYSIDMGTLLAGTKYRGDFESRLKRLINCLKKIPDSILFIDEIHTIIGAGTTSGSVVDTANIMKPILATGDIRCIGSTTYEEYHRIFEKDRALARRFQKIEVNEPSPNEATAILMGLKSRFESYHEIHYTQQALRAAVELTHRHINDKYLPDKAIDVIDEAGAAQRLLPASKRKKTVRATDIEKIIAKMTKIPTQSISMADKHTMKHLERDLKTLVFGQDEAISALVSALKMTRSGLKQHERPIGAFLFAGPTGVGKTEVTKQLAHIMGITLNRFDMSEYMERHTVSRLIGAPPGYVGFDQGGLLTDAIHKNPHSVLLLDEIEKAHPDLFNILLQVMDHGILTDTNGRKINFRNVIIVMTTNAAAERISRISVGFTLQDHSQDAMPEIKRLFPPEFRNRLDAIVHFKPLDLTTVMHVVDKFLYELEAQLADKNITLQVTPSAKKWLAKEGFEKDMGARPMARLIQEKIKKQLAEEMLFGELSHGGKVLVSVKEKQLTLKMNPKKVKAT